jgi:hypothetical protein
MPMTLIRELGEMELNHEDMYHVGVAVHRLEPAMEQLGAIFDTGWTPIAEGRSPGLATPEGPSEWGARLTHSRSSPIPIELLEGTPGSTWDTDQLARLHHVAYWSHHVASDVERLQRKDWAIELVIVDETGRPTDFAYLTKPGGIRIELVGIGRRPAHLRLLDETGG